MAPLEFLPEPVVHSTKWSTGSQLLPWFAPFPRIPAELVVHSAEWTTGSQLLPRFAPFSTVSGRASGPLDRVDHWLLAFALVCPFPQFLTELVVHSTEWTTGSQLLPRFAPFSPVSDRASGPLDGVDHWLLALALFGAVFRLSPYNCVKRKSQVISGTM